CTVLLHGQRDLLRLPSFPTRRSCDLPFNQILKQNAKREMRLRLGKVTVADVLAAQPVTTNLLKFMRASIKMSRFVVTGCAAKTSDRKSGSAGMPRPIA